MPIIGSNAGTVFPQGVDSFNASYDPNLGPALQQVQALEGCYPPEGLTNVTSQSIPDTLATSAVTLTAGTIIQTPLYLRAGQTVTNLSIITGVTASSTPTNQWAGLASPAGITGGSGATEATSKVVAISADGTTTAIAASTIITFALGTPYVVPASGVYIAFVCVAATTGPTASASITLGTSGRGAIESFICGPGATGQTTPPAVGATLTEITATSAQLLVYAN